MLNAKQHAREAEIVAQAGRPKMITIATNMAGRGTDIVLGGTLEPLILDAARRRDADRRAEGRADQDDARRVAGPPQRGDRRRRAAHHRHRAPRVAAHRQPAARPLRPPGRPGLVALLPVARGSAAAHLRRRAPGRDHAAAQDARGRADRAPDRQPLDRQGAEPRRDAQLRHPQAAARIRRRRQRPAPRDLPAAQRAAGKRRHRRHRSAT